ncbi:hypothetical protein [Lysobacter sp. FW306-1B-D06B]|uniref:hypothetical protein n=1 Tax=Lysobacter sp. FW306-1B-D06B TaxID=3140250 RepID=UPI0031407830
MKLLLSITASATALCLCMPARAQDVEARDSWKQTVYIYAMGAAIEGDAQIGILPPLSVELDKSDVLDALRMGGMVAYRIDNGLWSFSTDVTYMDLGWRASGPRGNVGGSLYLDQLTVMATGGYRFAPYAEVLLSAAYFDLDSELNVRVLQQTAQARRGASWTDGLIGMRASFPIGEKWSYNVRGDIGGGGSDLTWHFLTTFRRGVNDRFDWYFGYRVLSYDYSEGQGRTFQHYELMQHGPLIGVAISF